MSLLNSLVLLIIFIGIKRDLSTILNAKHFLVDAADIRGNDYKDLLLTNYERETLDLFKSRVVDRLPEPFMRTDFYLIRWLRAKNFDILEAEEMLMQNVKWREENKISNIGSKDFSDISERFPSTLDTHDKKGRPIGTINLGSWDLRAAVVQGKLPILARFVDNFQETLVQQILKAQQNGKEITRANVLIDLEGFNAYQQLCPSCVSIFVRLLVGMESHFPAFWEEVIIVNAPPIFHVVMDAIRGVMSKDFKQALHLFYTNKKIWMKYLDERIDRDQRYINFGGTKQPSARNERQNLALREVGQVLWRREWRDGFVSKLTWESIPQLLKIANVSYLVYTQP